MEVRVGGLSRKIRFIKALLVGLLKTLISFMLEFVVLMDKMRSDYL